MTKLLVKAFAEVAKLSGIEQNKVAKWLLDELASEKHWNDAFSESEDVLSRLADDAIEEHNQGKTKPLSLDNL